MSRLIPLYAVGVFTSFTLSQSAMAKRHWNLRQPGWRKGFLINGFGALMTAVVDVVIAVTKFVSGAWVIIAAIPVLVALLLRLNRQYEAEDDELEADAPSAATAPILRRHVVLVFVDRLDVAAARAIQYARTLMPDEVRAVHFILDDMRAEALAADWRRLGLSGVPLELRECSDRVIPHADFEAEVLAYARMLATEVSPRSLREMKREIWNAQFQGLGEAIDAANADMRQSFSSADFKEGVAHFVEKRAPAFTGG